MRKNRKRFKRFESSQAKFVSSIKRARESEQREKRQRERESAEHKVHPKHFSAVFSALSSGNNITLSTAPAIWQYFKWRRALWIHPVKRHKNLRKMNQELYVTLTQFSPPNHDNERRKKKLENDLKSFFMQETCLSSVMRSWYGCNAWDWLLWRKFHDIWKSFIIVAFVVNIFGTWHSFRTLPSPSNFLQFAFDFLVFPRHYRSNLQTKININ